MANNVPFHFYTSLGLTELLGKKASTLTELGELIRQVPAASIFYHTHQFLREQLFIGGNYTNDFAYWINEHLREESLAEKLANLDICEYFDLESLRADLIAVIKDYLAKNPDIPPAPAGEEFYFGTLRSVVLATGIEATDLLEFAERLSEISTRSLYYHFIEARLRLGHKGNDFSNWIRDCFGKSELAEDIERLDPYIYTLEELQKKIIERVRAEIKRPPILQPPHRVLRWLNTVARRLRSFLPKRK